MLFTTFTEKQVLEHKISMLTARIREGRGKLFPLSKKRLDEMNSKLNQLKLQLETV